MARPSGRIGEGRWRKGGYRRHQHGVLIPAFVPGRPDHPLACGSPAAVGGQDGGDLASRAGWGLPRAHGLAPRPHAPAVADLRDPLIAPTEEPGEHLGRATAPIQAEDDPLAALPWPAQAGFQCAEGRLQGGPRKITHITEVVGMEQDTVVMQDIYRYSQSGVDENGRAIGRFEATGIRPTFMARLEQSGVRLPASAFRQRVMLED